MSGKLRNLGPVSTQWLAEVGVFSRADLERVGSVAAYAMVRRRQQGASLNLLWALEAARLDCDWRELTQEVKNQLRQELNELTQ
ncbi:MAG: TfoX/Sxy family protein [Planctomycetales bacterium]|nr:TfoX/Sxy family protein [Planctomycetales bacterium]